MFSVFFGFDSYEVFNFIVVVVVMYDLIVVLLDYDVVIGKIIIYDGCEVDFFDYLFMDIWVFEFEVKKLI